MSSRPDSRRDGWMLTGRLASGGVERWRFVFPAIRDDTRDRCCIFIEYYACVTPTWHKKEKLAHGGQAEKRKAGIFRIRSQSRENIVPSYFAVHAGIWGDGAVQYTHVFREGETEISQGPPFVIRAGECLFTEFESYGSIPGGDDPERKKAGGMYQKNSRGGATAGGMYQMSPEVSGRNNNPYPVRPGIMPGIYGDEADDGLVDDTAMEWDIEFDKKISYNAGISTSPFSRKMNASDAYWHAEGLVTEYTGTIIIGDVSYRTFPDAGAGYADVTWGSGFPSPGLWMWTADMADSSGLPMAGDVLAVWGGRIRTNIPFSSEEKFLGALHRGKRIYEFNSLVPALTGSTWLRTKDDDGEREFHLILSGERAMLDARITCQKSGMISDNLPLPLNRLQVYRRYTCADGEGKIIFCTRSGPFGSYQKQGEITARHVVCSYGRCESART